MKRKRFKEEQIIRFLKEAEKGISVKDLCRQYGFSEQTFYRWCSKYGGMDANQLKYLKRLEAENRELKQMIAEISLENRAIKVVLEKNFKSVHQKKEKWWARYRKKVFQRGNHVK